MEVYSVLINTSIQPPPKAGLHDVVTCVYVSKMQGPTSANVSISMIPLAKVRLLFCQTRLVRQCAEWPTHSAVISSTLNWKLSSISAESSQTQQGVV